MIARVGDVIAYSPFGGGVRRVRVESIDLNGRPSFTGTVVGTTFECWGYDTQVIAILRRG